MRASPQHPGRPSSDASGPDTTRADTQSADTRRADARRADQRGSVLIFVIGVLLLLAIVATAFLGTSRSDRTATQQNAYNTQIDLLLEGVVNAMKGAILQDARYGGSSNSTDSLTGDAFIAGRVPTTFNPGLPAAAAATPATATNPAMWPAITGPLLDGVFSYPIASSALPGTPPATVRTRLNVVPSSITFNGQVLPALQFNATDETLPLSGYPANNYAPTVAIPAMDTDNDGIADAGMVRLPVGTLAGITYYYGARVVDTGSAINFNTANAWNEAATSNDLVATTAGTISGNFWPSNVDLYNALTGNVTLRDAQMNRQTDASGASLNGYRLGLNATSDNAPNASGVPHDDNTTLAAASTRTDYQFSGDNELLWMQLGRRLGNPGWLGVTGGRRQAKALDVNNAVAMARNFVLKDPRGAVSVVEKALGLSTQGDNSVVIVNSKPFAASDARTWFNNNFNYTPRTPVDQAMPLRAVLTGTSPSGVDVSSAGFIERGAYVAGNTYSFGDVVTAAAPSLSTRKFLCHAMTVTGVAPDSEAGLASWTLLGWVDQPRKVSVNTADFGELWWGFRRLMSDTRPNRPTPIYAAGCPFPLQNAASPVPATAADKAKWRMYRNTIRHPFALDPNVTIDPHVNLPASGGRYMSNSEMVQLRSALAAVNAMDLRDSDDYVTARRITTGHFPGTSGTAGIVPRHEVTVFGTERQPYITEVYVNNDSFTASEVGGLGVAANVKGYVAVELYNPYPDPIVLNGWCLGVIDRGVGTAKTPASAYPLQILPLLASGATRFDATYVIPGGGYLVLENYKDPSDVTPPLSGPDDAKHRPLKAGTTLTGFRFVPDLHRVLYESGVAVAGQANGGELVLLRPRKAVLSGPSAGYITTQQPLDPIDPCDEGTIAAPNLHDLVPIDSFDFTNMNVAPPTAPTFNSYHYVRENGAGGSWKWTQGRPYVITAGVATGVNQATQRQGATISFVSGTAEPSVTPGLFAVGLADGAGSSTNPDPHLGIQVNNVDWPSPRPNNGTQNLFSAGAFPRPTDMFQIPTIGAYKIVTVVSPVVTGPDGLVLPAETARDNAVGALEVNFTEMNCLPMDESFADDDDPAGPNDLVEQVGRLCTLQTVDPFVYRNYPYVDPATVAASPYGGTASPMDWYDPNFNFDLLTPVTVGVRSIFDIFTTADHDNALPNVSAEEYETTWRGANTVPKTSPPTSPAFMPAASSPVSAAKPAGVTYAVVTAVNSSPASMTVAANLPTAVNYESCTVQVLTGNARGLITTVSTGTQNAPTLQLASLPTGASGSLAANDVVRILSKSDNAVSDQGLININTAPWYVLDRLPMVLTTGTGAVDRAANSELAREIVLYRDGNPSVTGTTQADVRQRTAHGPFKSLADLNRLIDSATSSTAVFQTSKSTITTANVSTEPAWGDITPNPAVAPPPTPQSVDGDFEYRYLALSRISNMVTTRSDAFVVYITLQGWQDAGTANATLKTQRRAAFIIDRSGATSTAPNLVSTRVPVN